MMTRSIVSAACLVALMGTGTSVFAADITGSNGKAQPCAAPYDDARRGPFGRRDYITGVEPHRIATFYDKQRFGRLEGATVTLRPTPGVTREWLQQMVDDHLQLVRATGSTDTGDPLAVRGASARVSPTTAGFAVTIDATDRDAAKEILRRSEALITY